MARIQYKQKCSRCKDNYVIVTRQNNYPLCYDCQKKDLDQKVTDPAMKKMFNIPVDFYKDNAFLRSIKINYHRFGSLSEKQIAAFKKVVAQLKEES